MIVFLCRIVRLFEKMALELVGQDNLAEAVSVESENFVFYGERV